MATGNNCALNEVDPATERRWRLARRNDLADAFGIVFTVPWHGEDEAGNWRFGLRPGRGWSNAELTEKFVQEMRSRIIDQVSDLVSDKIISDRDVDQIEDHHYEVGPAAQSWPTVLFNLYQDARPFLNDGASLLAWASFFSGVVRSVRSWAVKTEQENSGSPESESTTYSGSAVMPGLVFTGPALVALCYGDLIRRHGVSGDVTVDIFPRSRWTYASAEHPAGQESYLIRAKVGKRSFFYHVLGTGDVLEHYLIDRATITLLPIPNLKGEEMHPEAHPPASSQSFTIKGR